MAIGNTNVKFSDLQTEFGGSNPINLSEYYKGGSYFKNHYFNHASYGTPSSSGQIKVGSFRYSANPTLNHSTSLNTLYTIDADTAIVNNPSMIMQYNAVSNTISDRTATSTADSSAIPNYNRYVNFGTSNVLDGLNGYTSGYYPLDYVKVKTFVVPAGCAYVDVEAWGAGGGGAGKYAVSGYTGSYGGSGGYCRTRLTVGTHINEGEVIYCSPGLPGGSALKYNIGGTGGGASIVWKDTRFITSFGSPNDTLDKYYSGEVTDRSTKATLNNYFSIGNAILCAGGGGGGSVGYLLTGANGGGGGNDGSNGNSTSSSAANTKATSNNNFTGYITNDNYTGTPGRGGNVWPYHGAYSSGTFAISNYTTQTILTGPSLNKAWFSSPSCDYSVNSFTNSFYNFPPSGGGGFYTSGAGQMMWAGSAGQNRVSRGGGGGTNAVYLGINQSVSNGGSPNAPVTSGILTSINTNDFCTGGQRDWAAAPSSSTYGTVGSHGQKGKIAIKFVS